MFPPIQVLIVVASILPSMAVVVDFPLVPVTPMISAGQRSMKRRISVVTGLPAVRGVNVRIARRNRRRGNDDVGRREIVLTVFSDAEIEGQTFQLAQGIGQFFRRIGIGNQNFRALCAEPARDGDSTAEAAEAGNRHSFSRQRFHAIR